ncbi:MAG TPA: choice-of-anchor Q domain-containing protein, partial [Polyangiaceae bacterium]|nr:choice-of-anchor Q domain-containing protein [Polyangiaceae bacterium]
SQYNWLSDTSCALSGTGDHEGAGALLLGPLADNGGFVPTRAPAAGSVLIDQIPSAACPTVSDARGIARPQGVACDIGAVEVVPTALASRPPQ